MKHARFISLCSLAIAIAVAIPALAEDECDAPAAPCGTIITPATKQDHVVIIPETAAGFLGGLGMIALLRRRRQA